jgi:serine/threonine-protein kinase
MSDGKPVAGEQPVRFGNYWLDAELAQGGMSRLVRARLRGPGGFEKKLVVKQILPQLASDPGFIELFVREANTLVQMSHPNIVPVYELGVIDGVYFLSMELVEGATVAELLRDGPLPEALCAHLGAQVCEALRYAHERFDLVHRDVTPRNVIIDADGHVRLLDFGIAAPLAHTGSGELFGSPGYMSPEQVRGAALSGQSDLFSLGTVLYEALTGRRAIEGATQSATEPIPQPRLDADAGVSAQLAALVHALLALDPAQRPASAAEAGTRFRAWLAQAHPEGVAAALGRRAERARTRGTRASDRPPPPIDTEPHRTPRVTRTIATSRSFVEIMAAGTERLPRAPASPAPIAQRTTRRARLGAAVLAVLVAALGASILAIAGSQRNDRAGESAARASTATPAPPPAAAPSASVVTEAPSRAPAPAATAQADAAAAHGLPEAHEPSTAAPRAHVNVNALPWAEVRVDGRMLGTTPKRALALAPGAHVLQLDCPPLGRSARIPLKLAPAADQQIVVDLQTVPPKITIR